MCCRSSNEPRMQKSWPFEVITNLVKDNAKVFGSKKPQHIPMSDSIFDSPRLTKEAESTKVKFSVDHPASRPVDDVSVEMYCIGSLPALGNWQIARGRRMTREVRRDAQGWCWKLDMYLPCDSDFLYQYVLRDQAGVDVWEGPVERHYTYKQPATDDRAPLGGARSTPDPDVRARPSLSPDCASPAALDAGWADADDNPPDRLSSRDSLLPAPTFDCTESLRTSAATAGGSPRARRRQSTHSSARVSLSGFSDCVEVGGRRTHGARMSLSGFDDCVEAGGGPRRPPGARMSLSGFYDCVEAPLPAATEPIGSGRAEGSPGAHGVLGALSETQEDAYAAGAQAAEGEVAALAAALGKAEEERCRLDRERGLVYEEVRRALKVHFCCP